MENPQAQKKKKTMNQHHSDRATNENIKESNARTINWQKLKDQFSQTQQKRGLTRKCIEGQRGETKVELKSEEGQQKNQANVKCMKPHFIYSPWAWDR